MSEFGSAPALHNFPTVRPAQRIAAAERFALILTKHCSASSSSSLTLSLSLCHWLTLLLDSPCTHTLPALIDPSLRALGACAKRPFTESRRCWLSAYLRGMKRSQFEFRQKVYVCLGFWSLGLQRSGKEEEEEE